MRSSDPTISYWEWGTQGAQIWDDSLPRVKPGCFIAYLLLTPGQCICLTVCLPIFVTWSYLYRSMHLQMSLDGKTSCRILSSIQGSFFKLHHKTKCIFTPKSKIIFLLPWLSMKHLSYLSQWGLLCLFTCVLLVPSLFKNITNEFSLVSAFWFLFTFVRIFFLRN